jgi:hypothetical protein
MTAFLDKYFSNRMQEGRSGIIEEGVTVLGVTEWVQINAPS